MRRNQDREKAKAEVKDSWLHSVGEGDTASQRKEVTQGEGTLLHQHRLIIDKELSRKAAAIQRGL
jgi:hypothetical protein